MSQSSEMHFQHTKADEVPEMTLDSVRWLLMRRIFDKLFVLYSYYHNDVLWYVICLVTLKNQFYTYNNIKLFFLLPKKLVNVSVYSNSRSNVVNTCSCSKGTYCMFVTIIAKCYEFVSAIECFAANGTLVYSRNKVSSLIM